MPRRTPDSRIYCQRQPALASANCYAAPGKNPAVNVVAPIAVKCRVALCDPLNGHEIPRQWPANAQSPQSRKAIEVRKRWVRHNKNKNMGNYYKIVDLSKPEGDHYVTGKEIEWPVRFRPQPPLDRQIVASSVCLLCAFDLVFRQMHLS